MDQTLSETNCQPNSPTMKHIKPSQPTLPPPDSLAASRVLPLCTTQWLGRSCYTVSETTTSTNHEARRLGEHGGPHGAVVVADTQTDGRGRHQRAWISPKGVGLYVSVLLRPHLPLEQAPLIGIAAAVAAASAIETTTPQLDPRIKWPNDILIDEGKVAGILAESHTLPDGSFFIIVGLGINVNTPQEQLPPRPRFPASSLLQASGHTISRTKLLAQWLTDLEPLVTSIEAQQPTHVLHAWQQRAYRINQPVCLETAGQRHQGKLKGIASDGALQLEAPDGTIHHILSGDLLPNPPSVPPYRCITLAE